MIIKDRKTYKRIVVISDMHIPYHHPDLIGFLGAVKKKFSPDKIVCIGDEIDGHSISYHEKDPELLAPSDEFQQAIKTLKPIYNMFPQVDLVESNHGSLVYRKGKSAGLPKIALRSPGEILQSPKGWRWSFDFILNTPLGPVYFHHGKSAKSGGLASSMGMNAVQGHYHSKFQIEYLANPAKLYWDMHVGCLADDKSLALSYNKTTLPRPIVGLGMIVDGKPLLIPMTLKSGGRWTGKL